MKTWNVNAKKKSNEYEKKKELKNSKINKAANRTKEQ